MSPLAARRRISTLIAALTFTIGAPCASAAEVAVVDPLKPVYDASAVQNAGAGPLRLSAPRNGSASAQVVVTGADAPAAGAEMGELVGPAGPLPANAVQIRYAVKEEGVAYKKPGHAKPDWVFNYTDAYCDRLLPAPTPGTDVVPAWVTVTVPADAAAGLYKGTLKVAGKDVPVELRVSDWLCPKPSDWAPYVGVVPSPEMLAKTYKVPFWSPQHWALIEQEMDFMGMLGVDELWLHVSAYVGTGDGLANVHFTTTDGKVVPDLRVAKKYLDTFETRVGKPKYVILNVWDGQPDRRARAKGKGGVFVFLDGEKGQIPRPEDKGGDEVWRPLMQGLHKLVTDKGWSEDSILLALAGDQRPLEKSVDTFKELAPYARWAIWTHGRGEKPVQHFGPDEPLIYSNGMEIAYYAHPYTPTPAGWVRPLGKQVYHASLKPELQGGWNQDRTLLSTARNDIHKYAAPSQWRCFPNGMTLGYDEIGFADSKGSAGFAFLWLDFWSEKGDGHPYDPQQFVNRWCTVMSRHNSPSLIEPGPSGPAATVRFEMLREGLQETEARCMIEKALLEGKLPADLAEKAKAVLTDGFNTRFNGGKFEGGHAGSSLGNPPHMWGVKPYPQWVDATTALYELAGQVAAATK